MLASCYQVTDDFVPNQQSVIGCTDIKINQRYVTRLYRELAGSKVGDEIGKRLKLRLSEAGLVLHEARLTKPSAPTIWETFVLPFN